MAAKPINSEILDRLPPASPDAEKAVLGSVMLDPQMVDEVCRIIKAGDFYAEANRVIYDMLLDFSDKRIPIDVVSIHDRLAEICKLEQIGGPAYLAEVAHSVPYAANAAYYAKIVARKSKLRRIINAAQDALRNAYDEISTPEETLDKIEQSLSAIRTDAHGDKQIITAMEAAIEVTDRIDAIIERGEHLGLATGFEKFDFHVGGLFSGELIILAARPGVGKTALACQIADYAAANGRLVYFISLEMEAAELAQRTICGIAGISGKSIRTGRLDGEMRKTFCDAATEFSRRNLRIDCRPSLKIYDIRRTARRLQKEDLRLIVIDYLQLLTPTDKKAIREQQVSEMSRGLKELARELKVPVLCLSQLNRASEEQERPQMKNLRESGAIEQDADMVMFIYRPTQGIQIKQKGIDGKAVITTAPWPAELILEKQRNGETMMFKLDWHPNETRFSTWETTVSDMPNYEPDFAEHSSGNF